MRVWTLSPRYPQSEMIERHCTACDRNSGCDQKQAAVINMPNNREMITKSPEGAVQRMQRKNTKYTINTVRTNYKDDFITCIILCISRQRKFVNNYRTRFFLSFPCLYLTNKRD